MDLASAVLLNYSQPLFLPFIAWLWLSEIPPARIYPAVAVGFTGVALILKPDLGWFGSAGFIGLAAGVLAACAMTAIRSMADTEPALRIVFYFCVFGVLFTFIPALLFWQTPSWTSWLAMAGAGSFATLGQLTLTQAYTLAPAAHIGSLVYATVLFAALLGWLFWGGSTGPAQRCRRPYGHPGSGRGRIHATAGRRPAAFDMSPPLSNTCMVQP